MRSLWIKNAKIATSTELFEGSLLVEGEKIAALWPAGAENVPAEAEVLDAGGMYLLPGGVDPHTHFDLDVGFTRASDDFFTGSVAAACGGTTTVIDHMAFGPKGCALTHQPQVYHQLAKPSVIDYGFHGTIQHVNDDVLADMAQLRDEEGITSLKLYLTYDYKLKDSEILRVLHRAKELGLLICVHCENDAILNDYRSRYLQQGHTQPRFHALSRPAQAEAEAVFRMMMLASSAGNANLYIVHLSSALGLDAIRLANRYGQMNTWVETCPQYLFLDDSHYNDDQQGLKYILSPPLRGHRDMEALWRGLDDGVINTIGTDHCPFFFESQKKRGAHNFSQCPNGMPGVELRLPLMFSEGFMKGRMGLCQVVSSCCTTPARIFGIAPQKGDITPGADADLVLFDPEVRWTVTHDKLHENVDYTPYEGMQLLGKPVLTLSRGEVICKNGSFTGAKGRGRYLVRGLPPGSFSS